MGNTSRKELNREFHQFYLVNSLPTMRVGLICTILLFFLFAIINRTLFPGLPELKFYMRFGLISPFIILTVIVMFVKGLQPWLSRIYIILNFSVSLLIFGVGASATPAQPGYEHYSEWVMLVIMGLFTFYRLRFLTLSILGLLMVLAYVLATLVNGTCLSNVYLFYNNLFFVISMYSIGFFMAYILEKLTLKNFLHQKALSDNNRKLLNEIKERKEAEKALHSSEQQYHHTLD
jgi:phosphoglycerate-specific signal transduction histidine kinase